MSRVRQGDMVAVMGPQGVTTYSPVLMMLHASPATDTHFVQLRTGSGEKLTLTPSHLLLKEEQANLNGNKTKPIKLVTSAVFADKIVKGDNLLVNRNSSSSVTVQSVYEVTSVRDKGVFAPLTAEGNIIVDGIVVSCYAVIDSQSIAHWAFLPVRIYYRIKGVTVTVFEAVGLMPYINKGDNNSSLVYQRNWKPRLKAADIIKEYVSVPSNFSNTILNTENSINSAEFSIHWYPKLLYSLARFLLPNHLIYNHEW